MEEKANSRSISFSFCMSETGRFFVIWSMCHFNGPTFEPDCRVLYGSWRSEKASLLSGNTQHISEPILAITAAAPFDDCVPRSVGRERGI